MSKCYVNLAGRLGNQLFQIAAGYNYCRKFDKQLIVCYNSYQLTNSHNMDIIGFYKDTIFQNFNFGIIDEPAILLGEDSIKNFYSGNVQIGGYFQSLNFFEEFEKDYKKLLILPKMEVINRLDVAFHIRRGDYMGDLNYASICNTEYFDKCFDRYDNRIINIFTDSPEYVCQEFNSRSFNIIETGSALKDLTLISMHDTIVCSNSSFSWWASFLGNLKSEIIVPPRWMRDNECVEVYRREFIKLK